MDAQTRNDGGSMDGQSINALIEEAHSHSIQQADQRSSSVDDSMRSSKQALLNLEEKDGGDRSFAMSV